MIFASPAIPRFLLPVLLLFALLLFTAAPGQAAPSAATEKNADILGNIPGIGTQSPAASPTPSSTPGTFDLILNMFAGLALVLALIAATAWLLRRYGVDKIVPGKNDSIRILSSKSLGNRRSLFLVRVRGQTLLLGVTPQNINTLTEVQEMEGEWAQPPETIAPQPGASPSFKRHLGRSIQETITDDPHPESNRR